MVPAITILYMAITLFLSVLVPVLILVLLRIKAGKNVYVPWLAGALGFFVPQMIIRIPLMQLAGYLPGFMGFVENNLYMYFAFLAVSAAVFETAGRLIVFKIVLKHRLSYVTGLSAGAGHGAIESILIIGMTYVNNLVFSILLNNDLLSVIIKDESTLDGLIQSLTGTSSELFLMAGVERVFTMALHICLSVILVFFILKSRTILGVILVLTIHAAVDFAAVVLQYNGWSPLLIEGSLFAVAVISVITVVWIRKYFTVDEEIYEEPAEAAVREGY